MPSPKISTFREIIPLIYSWTTPDIPKYAGWEKIGYTEQETADARIAQQASHPALAEAIGAALIDLRPDLQSEDDLWSLDPEILGEHFNDYFGGNIPLVPVAGRLQLRLRQG